MTLFLTVTYHNVTLCHSANLHDTKFKFIIIIPISQCDFVLFDCDFVLECNIMTLYRIFFFFHVGQK